MYLDPDDITVGRVGNNSVLLAVDKVADLDTHPCLSVLSVGTGLLYISNGLWCFTGQNQGASFVLDYHVILNPDAQASEMLWHLVIVLTEVQPCDNRRKRVEQ